MKPFLAVLAAALALACSAHRQAGTGDVAFRLLWSGQSDLDLFVEEPAGECISFAHRQSASGGLLDLDCNAGSGRLCERPIENVFWPAGSAPYGPYRFWVHAHSLIPAEAPLEFEVQVLRGPRVVWKQGLEMVEHDQTYAFSYRFPEAPGVAELVPATLDCRRAMWVGESSKPADGRGRHGERSTVGRQRVDGDGERG